MLNYWDKELTAWINPYKKEKHKVKMELSLKENFSMKLIPYLLHVTNNCAAKAILNA